MTEHRTKHPVEGSERTKVPDAKLVGPVPDDAPVEVTVRLRAGDAARARKVYEPGPGALDAPPLTREELLAAIGGSGDDVARVEAFAKEHGMTVLGSDRAGRSLRLRGTAAAMQSAFGVELSQAEMDGHRFRHREGPVHVPAELDGIVEGVYGLDDRPQARAHVTVTPSPKPAPANPEPLGFTAPELAHVYEFPAGDGAGQCVGVVALGGGYRAADLEAYATRLGLPKPRVVDISIDGAANAPDAQTETTMDVQILAGTVPAATIAVYFAPNTDRGYLDALTAAVHDTVNRPSVIALSWGRREDLWTSQARTAFNQVLQEAAAIGVPVFAAAGDNGATDSRTDKALHVDFPASSPYAVGCGGTKLHVQQLERDAEVVWNEMDRGAGATGGGFSAAFTVPDWQVAAVKGKGGRGRGVPDIAGNAAAASGHFILMDGQDRVLGGTSAVAPLMAGLAARCNAIAGHGPGRLPARLYTVPADTFTDITSGNNGGFSAGPGWDACTGLGVPVGVKLFAAIWATSPATTTTTSTSGKKQPA
jgi:kumamolisin